MKQLLFASISVLLLAFQASAQTVNSAKSPTTVSPKSDAMEVKTAKESDQVKIQGTWKAISGEFGGRTMKPPANTMIEFSGNRVMPRGRNIFQDEATFTLDPNKTPKEINLSKEEDDGKIDTIEAIYTLEGNELVLCMEDKGSRPKAFVTAADDKKTYIMKLKRLSPEELKALKEKAASGPLVEKLSHSPDEVYKATKRALDSLLYARTGESVMDGKQNSFEIFARETGGIRIKVSFRQGKQSEGGLLAIQYGEGNIPQSEKILARIKEYLEKEDQPESSGEATKE
ncbi:MAG: TIGR03067 domain-containing protein [Puniceicoccales bacterium]|jgi:uncharacterized protein (TIGR03067 family)|nr:TIGR03067 domain-containing protein [Puniceicoccales bacterium]